MGDGDELIVIWKQAMRYGIGLFAVSQDREDFASYCVEQVIKGRSTFKNIKLGWLYIDWLRQTRGEQRDKKRREAKETTRKRPGHGFVSIGRAAFKIEDVTQRPQPIWDVEARHMSDVERPVFILYFKWGMSLAEIGEVMGYTESRACQRLKEAMKSAKR